MHGEDENGWQSIHEAARGGHLQVVRMLIEEEHDADMNAVTNNGEGSSPLHIASANQGSHCHKITLLLSILPRWVPKTLDQNSNLASYK